jgi:hypothetical protein
MAKSIFSQLIVKFSETLSSVKMNHSSLRTLNKFVLKLKHQESTDSGPWGTKFTSLLDRKFDPSGHELDHDKAYYLEHLLLMHMMALKCFLDNKKTECLIMVKYMLRLPVVVPDYLTTIHLFSL